MKNNDVNVEGLDGINKKMLESQLDHKKKQLCSILDAIPRMERLLELQKQVKSIDEELGKIIVDNFNITEFDNDYQRVPEFTELMIRKQLVINEKNSIGALIDIEKMKDNIDTLKLQIPVLEEQINHVKKDLEGG